MMKLQLFLFLTFIGFQVNASEYPYVVLPKSFIDVPGSIKEILPVTPSRSQDGLGICYGFSATSLLEHYRCRELKLDCSNPSEFLSTLDVTSYLTKDKRA